MTELVHNSPSQNPQQLWQSQPVEGIRMSAEAIRLRAGKFERRVSRRNLREYAASALVVGAFAYFFVMSTDIWYRLTWGLFIGGMIFVTIQLRLKGAPRNLPADMGAHSSLDFYRSELERQHDLVSNIWPWHLAPLVPGFIAYNVAYVMTYVVTIRRPAAWVLLAALDLIFVCVFVLVWRMNVRAARCLQRMIDDLQPSQQQFQ